MSTVIKVRGSPLGCSEGVASRLEPRERGLSKACLWDEPGVQAVRCVVEHPLVYKSATRDASSVRHVPAQDKFSRFILGS